VPLREAIVFLKGAVARSLPGGAPSTYVFHEGTIYAQSAAVLAAYPVPHILGTFGLSADDIEGAVGRMPAEPVVEPGDGTLILRAGRLRSSIQLFAAAPPGHALPDVNWESPPAGLLPAIDRVLPFMSSEGTWHRSVELVVGAVRAVSNAATCMVEVVDLGVGGPTALTDDAARYLASLPEPSGWKTLPNALAFSWPSGAWVRCQLLAQEWPKMVDTFFDAKPTPVEVTADFREAFADVKALGDGTVDLGPDGMVGMSPHAEHHAECATGVAKQTRWALKALSNVLDVATAWDPDAEGHAVAFRGDGCRGIIAGMTR
jgi:hypothetical protein